MLQGKPSGQGRELGAIRSELRGYDKSGLESEDPASAEVIVITEWDSDGNLVWSTTAGAQSLDGQAAWDPMPPAAGEYNDPWNTELGKGTWDVWVEDNSRLVETLDELYRTLGWAETKDEAERVLSLANLVTLPSWEAAPARLKAQAAQVLGAAG